MYHEIQMLAGRIQQLQLLLAQESGGAEGGESPQGPGSGFLLLLLGVLVFMFMFSPRAAKKRRNQKNQMLNSIRKYSEVITIGGLCGTVVEIEESDDDEPVPTHFLIEVDAGSGSRIRVVAEAIGRVLDAESEDSSES